MPVTRSGQHPRLWISFLAGLGLLLGTYPSLAQDAAADQGWSQNQPYSPGQDAPAQPYSDAGAALPQQVQPLNAGQVEQLVAPIALYPDALVAQVLAASTYPGQVADADRWREMSNGAPPEQIAADADAQNWDPAVKALTAFPRVLMMMARNLQWTTDLGNAYYNQPQDVLEAVQVMRHRAAAAGSLQTTPQEVVRYDNDDIELVAPNPQVVYVPAYNPWAVYGQPVSPYPGFSLLDAMGNFFTGAPLRYGLGIAMAAFIHTPWGWLAWGLNWLTQAILFNHSDYYSHSGTVADWGFGHRGWHAYAGHGGYWRGGHEFARNSWGGESWRHGGGFNGGGWHSFGRESGRGLEGRHFENRGFENRGFESRSFENRGLGRSNEIRGERSRDGFQSFRNDRGLMANNSSRSINRGLESSRAMSSRFNDRVTSRAPERSFFGSNMGRSERAPSYRASAGSFRTSEFRGKSSDSFARSSFKSSHSGGLFGGHNSQKSFHSSHSSSFRSKAPKGFGGGKSFGGGRSFGGGGHSHGGGHSGGHGGGGGKHHR